MKKLIIFITSALISNSVFSIDLEKAHLSEIHNAIKNKEITSEQLVKFYLKRIENYNKENINAIITVNENVLTSAKEWDKSGNKDLLLGGIPFLVKDNYNVVHQPNTAGSTALKKNVADYDATVVKLLKQNGAIVLGRTNMSELAASYGRFGYSSQAGQTLNPLNPQRDPSGSSSGSAAAVAAHFAPFALGTDTTGSIRGPASVTGLVGYRPSMGVTSRVGVVPLSLTFDTTGPLVRSVEDLALIMDVIAKKDEADQASVFYYQHQPSPKFSDSLQSASLKGKRLGFITNYSGANSEVDTILGQAMSRLKQQGADIIDVQLPSDMAFSGASISSFIIGSEFKSQLEAHLSSNNSPINLADVVQALKTDTQNPHPINPKRLAALENAISNNDLSGSKYISLLNQVMPDFREKLNAIRMQHRLDGFVFATRPCPAAPLPGYPNTGYQCQSKDLLEAGYIASMLGYPEVSIPAGLTESNIPVSLSFLGGFGEDVEMVKLGYAFEKIAGFSAQNRL